MKIKQPVVAALVLSASHWALAIDAPSPLGTALPLGDLGLLGLAVAGLVGGVGIIRRKQKR